MKNAVSGLGLAPEAATATFPVDIFLAGGDLAPLRARKHEFYDGLTRWRAAVAQTAAGSTPMISVEGASYKEALLKANDVMLARLWSDGLPLWPATPEDVDRILRGATLPRTHIIGKFLPRGGVTTVETCAIALAMAGGRPEYLPVLIAAVEAFFDVESHGDFEQATSCSPFPVVIVNGPIAKEIRLNSGFGCLGPDPQRPAGASIGRALRLLQQNVGGAVPGIGTIATFGAMRYTNAVFAEDEAALPPGWQTHATERHGFAPGTSSVSLAFATGVANIRWHGPVNQATSEADVLNGMWHIADYMRTPNILILSTGYEQATSGIVFLPPVVANMMAEAGWTKSSIRRFLWEHSKIPMAQLRRAGAPSWIENMKLDPWPVTGKPENIVIVVAGGNHPKHAYFMQANASSVVGRVIRVPESFDRLLADADRELGCGSDACMI